MLPHLLPGNPGDGHGRPLPIGARIVFQERKEAVQNPGAEGFLAALRLGDAARQQEPLARLLAAVDLDLPQEGSRLRQQARGQDDRIPPDGLIHQGQEGVYLPLGRNLPRGEVAL